MRGAAVSGYKHGFADTDFDPDIEQDEQPTVAQIIEQVAERVGFLSYDKEHGEVFLGIGDTSNYSTMITKSGRLHDPDGTFAMLLLGALCEWCQERDYYYSISNEGDSTLVIIYTEKNLYQLRSDSDLKAALLAVLEALNNN
jgi:hypothetical protein